MEAEKIDSLYGKELPHTNSRRWEWAEIINTHLEAHNRDSGGAHQLLIFQ